MNKKYKKFKIVMIFSLILILINIITVNASVEIIGIYDDIVPYVSQQAFTGHNHKIFWDDDGDRWYALTENGYSTVYMYSDSGDLSSWNEGGLITDTASSWDGNSDSLFPFMGCWSGWVYDKENDIGHIIYSWHWGSLNNPYPRLYYRNFTISEGGSLVLGTARMLIDGDVPDRVFCDIVLDSNNFPVILMGGVQDSDYYIQVWFPNSINAYGSEFEVIRGILPVSYSRNVISGIPMGSGKVMVLSADSKVDRFLYYSVIEDGVTTNATVEINALSDSTIEHWEDGNDYSISNYASSYNETHACISYFDGHYGKCFIIDFETLTKSEEYIYSDLQDYTINDNNWKSGVSVENNEFFASSLAYSSIVSSSYYDVPVISEQHIQDYTLFNKTQSNYLWNYNYSSGVGADYDQSMFSKTTDDEGISLFFYKKGTSHISVLAVKLEGEYDTPEPEIPPEPINYNLLFTITGFITIAIVLLIMMYVKFKGESL